MPAPRHPRRRARGRDAPLRRAPPGVDAAQERWPGGRAGGRAGGAGGAGGGDVDVPGLTPLRAGLDGDALTDGEHAAVLDAAALLDALRPAGYGFALARDGTLTVRPPAGTRPDEGVRSRVAALAPALGYVLRLEQRAAPLPAVCRQCGAPVEQFTPEGAA